MDLIDWNQQRFQYLVELISPFLKKSGFNLKFVSFVPISGYMGENLITVSDDCDLKKWYTGPTLVGLIDQLEVRMLLFALVMHHRESSVSSIVLGSVWFTSNLLASSSNG